MRINPLQNSLSTISLETDENFIINKEISSYVLDENKDKECIKYIHSSFALSMTFMIILMIILFTSIFIFVSLVK